MQILPRTVLIRVKRFVNRLRRAAVSEVYAFWRRRPVDRNVVLYESFSGNGVLCNPEAIFRGLRAAPDFTHLKHVWVLANERENLTVVHEFARDPSARFVRPNSLGYYRALATSGYLINNATFPVQFSKRVEQIYLNTWHGTPLKRMGYDIGDPASRVGNVIRNFLAATSDELPNGQLLLAKVEEGTMCARNQWRVLLDHSPEVDLSPAVALKSFLLIGTKHAARNSILVAKTDRLISLDTAEFEKIAPWANANVRLVMSPEWTSRSIIVSRVSYIDAPAAFEVDLGRPNDPPALIVDSSSPSRGDQYVEDLIWAPAADSTRIPITIVYNRETLQNSAKTLLTGYGAYNVSMEARYNPLLLQLLDQGVLFAIAHVRGGGENGNLWHTAARRLAKCTSFTDFLACRDHLVQKQDGLMTAGSSHSEAARVGYW